MTPAKKSLAAIALTVALATPAANAVSGPVASTTGPQTGLSNLDDFSGDARYAAFYNQKIDWSTELCDGHNYPKPGRTYKCAQVKVPLDWHDPSKGSINVGIGRVLEYGDWSEGNDRRLLISNPGGPGGNGLNFGAVIHTYMGLVDTHNAIGIDPRGVGLSTNLICPDYPEKPKPGSSWADGDSSTFNRASVAVDNQMHYEQHQNCIKDQAGLVEYINTEQTARDFNFVRHLLGYQTADIFGVSYGTWLGSTMEKMFPNSFDRVLLDGNMDWGGKNLQAGFAHQALAFQAANDKQLLPFIGRHHDVYGLGESAYAVNFTINSLRKAVKAGKFGEDITVDMFKSTQVSHLYGQSAFDPFARLLMAMKAHLAGEPDQLEAIRTTILRSNSMSPTLRSVFQVVPCADTANEQNNDVQYRRNEANGRNLPLIAPGFVSNFCKGWTHKPALGADVLDRPVGNVLMMQNEGDPATGYVGAWNTRVRAHGEVTMVTIDDLPGHGMPFFENECAMTHMLSYLKDGVKPTSDAFCQAGPITSGGVTDEKVYEFGRAGSESHPRPRAYPYIMRMLQEPVVDQAATDKYTAEAGARSMLTTNHIVPEDLSEVRNAVWGLPLGTSNR